MTADPAQDSSQPQAAAKKLSCVETILTIVSIYVGSAVLAAPFALAQGGWAMLLLWAAMCCFTGLTALLLGDCAAKVSADRAEGCASHRVSAFRASSMHPAHSSCADSSDSSVDDISYAAIGAHACGAAGKWAVAVGCLLEMLLFVVSAMIQMWKMIAVLWPGGGCGKRGRED